MCDLNTKLKNLQVTFGHALPCPLCFKEQAHGFLLLSTAAKLQKKPKTNKTPQNQLCSFLYIWHVANSHDLLQPAEQILSMSVPFLLVLKWT